MGDIILWISVESLRKWHSNKSFWAYSEKTQVHCLQVSIPFSAINAFEKSEDSLEGMKFLIYEKSKW